MRLVGPSRCKAGVRCCRRETTVACLHSTLTLRGTAVVFLVIYAATPSRAADLLLPDLIVWESASRCYMHCGAVTNTNPPNKTVYRFAATTANIGAGPLEVREFTHSDATQDIYQRIYDTDGGITEELI